MITQQGLLGGIPDPRLPRAPVQHRAVAGIDLSLTSCALVIGQVGEAPLVRVYSSKPAESPRDRRARYRSLVDPIVALVQEHNVAIVLIEGAAHGAMVWRHKVTKELQPMPQQGHADRSELRGVLIDRLLDVRISLPSGPVPTIGGRVEDGHVLRYVAPAVLEPNPSTLKQYQGGKGNLSKTASVSAFTARLGRAFSTTDEADAYALMMLAMCVSGQSSPETAPQRKAVLTVLSLLREAA